MAPKCRHTAEQIIRKLREADRMLGEGQEVGAVAKHLEVSKQTLQRWRPQYARLEADDADRQKEFERENITNRNAQSTHAGLRAPLKYF
jgi:putative transposase